MLVDMFFLSFILFHSFFFMDRELQILVGVMKRIEIPSGVMTSLMVPKRLVQVLVSEEISNLMQRRKTMEKRVKEMPHTDALKKEKEWKEREGNQGQEMLMIGGNKRDQDGLMIRNLVDTILKMIIQGRGRDPEHMIGRM